MSCDNGMVPGWLPEKVGAIFRDGYSDNIDELRKATDS